MHGGIVSEHEVVGTLAAEPKEGPDHPHLSSEAVTSW